MMSKSFLEIGGWNFFLLEGGGGEGNNFYIPVIVRIEKSMAHAK